MPDRDILLALLVGFPAGFVSGFCTAPVLYVSTYKGQWTNFSTMLTGAAILALLIAGLLAAAWCLRFRLLQQPATHRTLEVSMP